MEKNLKNKKMKIAIIDSGIDLEHPRLGNANISGAFIKKIEQDHFIVEDNFIDDIGHGTACAAIINKIIPNVELVAVKISSKTQIPDEKLLYEALEWCIKDEEINIINISMGCATSTPYNKLFEVCENAFKKNKFIIAATHNDPTIECYPAYFSNVIGVCGGQTKNSRNYGFLENEKINIIAKGITQRVAWINRGYKITMGSSFAAAHFTAIMAQLLIDNPKINRDEIYKLLKKHAAPEIKPLHFIRSQKINRSSDMPSISSYNLEKIGQKVFKNNEINENVKNALVFPISEKEMLSLNEFKNLSTINVELAIDYPRTLSDINKIKSKENILKRLPKDDELKDIDTFVIGYFYEHLFDANVEFGKHLIEIGIKLNKNFLVWSKPLFDFLKRTTSKKLEYTGKIYAPLVTAQNFTEILNYKYIDPVTAPSILVIGTSNRQGKFTTQLRLLEILKKEDYDVELISTEPQGVLFGANHYFPYGHESTVEIEDNRWVNYLTSLMRGIQKFKNPHIFLSGIQSNLIPRTKSFNELGSKNMLTSLQYLAGFQPDGIICAINPQDSIDFINQTINTVRIYSNAKILFYVMTPWYRNFEEIQKGASIRDYKYLRSDEINSKMNEISQVLGVPVLDIMDLSNDVFILDIIESAFAKENNLTEIIS